MKLRLIATGLCTAACFGTAQAELGPAAKMGQVAANQLGLLEYCQAHGQASAAAVTAEREAIAGAPASRVSTVKAEELGRQGYSVSPDGQQLPVAVMASRDGMTVPALCEDLARSSLTFQMALRQQALRASGGDRR